MFARASLAVAATALALAAPSYAAPPNDAEYTGGCTVVAVNDTAQVVLGPNDYRFAVVGAVVAAAPTAGHNPVHVTLSCVVRIDGVAVHSTIPSSNHVAAATVDRFIQAEMDHDSVVEVCTDVKTFDGHQQERTAFDCVVAERTELLPAAVADLVCPEGDVVCAVVLANRVNLLVGTP